MRDSNLFILEPPYVMARWLRDLPPALGAVALLDTLPERPTTNVVKAQMDTAPWCPLCLIAGADSTMRSTRRLPRTCVVFGIDEDDGASAILKAVAARPRPTPSDLVEWIVRRTKLPSLARLLSDLFTRPLLVQRDLACLPHAVREQLRMLGDWSAAEWQRAAALAELAADRTQLNRTMSAQDRSSAEIRSWITELLQMTERDFHDRYGWEWVLEASLRQSGFFEMSQRGVKRLRPRVAEVPLAWSTGPGYADRVPA